STAFLMSGAMVLSILVSSICGVMNNTARFMPGWAVGVSTVSRAIARLCRLGVVLRKSGLKDCKLTSQSLAEAWLIREPDNDTKLRSSLESAGSVAVHAPR